MADKAGRVDIKKSLYPGVLSSWRIALPLIEKSILIDAPIELVYRVSQDYAVRYEWDPFPESISVVLSPRPELSIGTRVLVRSKIGMTMLVEFIQVSPPNRAAIKMLRGPLERIALYYFSRMASKRLAGLKRYCEASAAKAAKSGNR